MTLTCALVEERDLVPKYLNGSLPQEESEAFEAHYFGCDACWSLVQRGQEIRAAANDAAEPAATVPTMTVPAPSRRYRAPWPWLAAAASVVLAVSLWHFVAQKSGPLPADESAANAGRQPSVAAQPPTPTLAPSPIERSNSSAVRSPDGTTLRLRATAAAKGIQLDWPAHPKAARYIVKIFAADGTPVLSRESARAGLTLQSGDFGDRSATDKLFARVQAEDALGVIIASSERVELPVRRKTKTQGK